MQSKPDLRKPLFLTAFLLAYSNGLTWLAYKRGLDPERAYLFANPTVLLAMLIYASMRSGGLQAVGLTTKRLPLSILLGLGAGGVLSTVPLIFFHKPIVLDTPLEFGPVAIMTRDQLIEDIALRVSINIAFMEELAFRGLLYDSIRTRFDDRAAILGSSAVFGLWHFAVTYASTQQTNMAETARLPRFLRPYTHLIATLGGMSGTAVAGLIFAYLRKRTGSLFAPIAGHWLVDSIMVASLWRSAHKRKAIKM